MQDHTGSIQGTLEVLVEKHDRERAKLNRDPGQLCVHEKTFNPVPVKGAPA